MNERKNLHKNIFLIKNVYVRMCAFREKVTEMYKTEAGRERERKRERANKKKLINRKE